MASESALLTRFLDEARHAFDEVLRFLQAQARQFADDLDDADFLVGRVFLEGDRELGLRLGSRSRSGGSATTSSSSDRSSGGDAELLLHVGDQLDDFHHAHLGNRIENFVF